MQAQVYRNSAVVAKIKSIYGKRITKHQLIELANCKEMKTLVAYLKNNTVYSSILKDVDESIIRRGQLENLLKKQNFNNYEKIFHYFNNSDNIIFDMIVRELEISEILKVILLIKINSANEYIINLPGYLISKCKINLLKLATVKSFNDLLVFLENTHYYSVLKKLKPVSENLKSIDYAACEHALFCHFFKHTFERINKQFNYAERFKLKNILKLEIDYLNICSIYREKIIFNSDLEKIYGRIFSFHRILNKERIKILAASKSEEEFKINLKKWFPNSDFNERLLKKQNFYIENYFDKLKCKLYRHLIYLSNSVSTVFYAFYKLTKIELSNLISTIEGVRYGCEVEEILNLHIY